MFNVLVPISKKPVKALLKLKRDDFDLISLGREFQNLVVDTENERPPSVSILKNIKILMSGFSAIYISISYLINYSYKMGNPHQVV